MRARIIAVTIAVAALAALGWVFRDSWRGWLAATATTVDKAGHDHAHEARDRVRLSPQAQANLRLLVKPLRAQTYWRTIQVPGLVVERRGQGDRGIVAPIAGVVKRVFAVPGDTVPPGADVITLALNSESLQASQTELYKTTLEMKITQAELKRLEAASGSVPEAKILEVRYRLERLGAVRKAYRQDLANRGLQPAQIDPVEEGRFLKEVTVRAPARPVTGDSPEPTGTLTPLYEVEELKVQLGEQVQAGQVLGYLSDHQALYIEGRGFKEDAALVERSAARGWPVAVTFPEEAEGSWPPLDQELTIQHLANTLDPVSQTFPFFIPLANQHREYARAGKTYRIWRFRPGQRVRLGVRVQEFADVFVLPAEAVLREGPEAYVFRQNGDVFMRRPVQVLFEDSAGVVLANDGSVTPGSHVAHNAAAALGRALRSQAAGDGHGHDHHHHEH
jgi:biotin carboxyl carrier protein